ncbi:HDOD domain-containing protein [Kaarinaea lacus]
MARETSAPAAMSDTAESNQKTAMNVDKFIADLLHDLKKNQLELPTLPQVAVRISQVIDDPNSRAKEVAQIIGADPALSARMIQVANSPLVRGDSKIDNLQNAITRMGTTMVRNIVTSFLVKQLFRTEHKPLQQRMTDLWNHSAHVAAISHVLAVHFSTLKADEVMLAGLLHDIGKLPILAKARKITNIEANEKALDMILEKLHPALGKAILQAWRFEADIVAAAADHENINRDSKILDHTDIVIVANLHSYMGKANAKKVDLETIPAMSKLSLDAEASLAVLKEAHSEIVEIQRLLSN